MAEINVERKKSIWPWIIAIIIALLLIWALMEMLDRDDDVEPVVVPATTMEPVATAPVATAVITAPAGEGLLQYAGVYASENMQLNLDADGTYTMSESPAGEGTGTWTRDESANALHLRPADGTPDRYFRIEGDGVLTPLNEEGEPVAQMAQLRLQTTE